MKGRTVYTANLKTFFILSWVIWIVLLAASVVYMWVKGMDIAAEVQEAKDSILFLTGAIAVLSVLLPAISWQRVEIDKFDQTVRIRHILDRLLSRTKTFGFAEIASVEKKYKARRGEILYIQLHNGRKHRVNLTSLKQGGRLERTLHAILQDD